MKVLDRTEMASYIENPRPSRLLEERREAVLNFVTGLRLYDDISQNLNATN